MPVVEIRIDDENAFEQVMKEMREWLDHRQAEPATFRYAFTPPGVLCRIDFIGDQEASEFAQAFGGTVLSAKGAALSPR
jgi:hypothetical protein